jgi:histone deacetylase 1/2
MNGHVVHLMDVNNVFLQVDLHEEIYVMQPEGLVNPDWPHHVYRLKKVLYGLKQAPLAWNCTLNAFLIQISFTVASVDPCLYTLHNHCASSDSDQGPYDPELHCTFIHSSSGGRLLVILSVYVDDLLIVGLPVDVDAIKKQLCQWFHIKDFGSVSTILVIDVVYNTSAGTLDISQQQKILNLATEFKLLRAKLLSCPLPVGTDLRVVELTSLTHASLKFRCLVGVLLYIALAT